MVHDTTKTIAKSASRVFSGTFLSRITGLLREIAMAAAFGTAPAVAAFWMAYRFAHLFRRILGEGALNIAFIPYFEGLRAQDPEIGARFFYHLLSTFSLFLLGLTLVTECALGAWLQFGNPTLATQEVVRLTMLLFPALLFISLYALNTSLLQCEGTFFLPSVAPAVVNLFWVGAVIFFFALPIESAMERLAMVIVFAFALQWVVTLPATWRYLTSIAEPYWWKKKGEHKKEILRVLKPFTFAVIGVAATQINTAADALFARSADLEGPAILWYAIRLQQLPLALFGIAITSALLPPLSRAIQRGEMEQAIGFFHFALRKIIALLLPITFGFLAVGFALVNCMYGRGAFGDSSILRTSSALFAYSVGLVPMTLTILFASAFYAQKNTKFPTYISLVSVGCNLVLNVFFVFGLGLGVISIAIATSISAVLNTALLSLKLRTQYPLFTRKVILSFLKVAFASVMACAMTLGFGHWVTHDQTLAFFLGESLAAFPKAWAVQMLELLSQTACFALVLFLVAKFISAEDLLALMGKKFANDRDIDR